jgi:hypothetical protein
MRLGTVKVEQDASSSKRRVALKVEQDVEQLRFNANQSRFASASHGSLSLRFGGNPTRLVRLLKTWQQGIKRFPVQSSQCS